MSSDQYYITHSDNQNAPIDYNETVPMQTTFAGYNNQPKYHMSPMQQNIHPRTNPIAFHDETPSTVHAPTHPSMHSSTFPVMMPEYKYNTDTFNISYKDILKRAVKYLIEGLAVAFVAYYFVGKNKLNIKDIVILGITAAFVFAILDTFSPTVSLGVRFGAGFGIGQGLFGLNPTILAGAPMVV